MFMPDGAEKKQNRQKLSDYLGKSDLKYTRRGFVKDATELYIPSYGAYLQGDLTTLSGLWCGEPVIFSTI
jgi:hypothetical protein